MRKFKYFFSIILIASVFSTISLYGATTFTGFTGGKLNYSANSESNEYDPDLNLQAFFAGQFNFSQNTWAHLEFSIETQDFINTSLFDATDSLFQIDELSFIARTIFPASANYFSLYLGTYDPIGSDLFLRRYFGIEPIASKLTESWLGLAGSILYPHFGVGFSDILKSNIKPTAGGVYFYINHEDNDYFVFNADLRAACAFRLFTCDFACGIGAPLSDKYKGEDVIIAVDKLYWHAGTTLLFGNNYTTSLFLQGGIFNAAFTVNDNNMIVGTDDIYLLFEPRFFIKNAHMNLSVYSLPKKTVDKILFVDDTLGADINVYTDNLLIGSQEITFGTHLAVSFVDKSFMDIKDIKQITSNGFNVNFTPYFSTTFLSGELHAQAKVRFMDFANGFWYKAISADVGYSCKL